MKAISSGDYGVRKDRFEYQALQFACVVSVSMFLISTENAWSQCVPATGQLNLNGGTCSEIGAIRDLDASAGAAPVISVTNGGNYTGTSVSLSNATSHPGHGLSVDGAGSIARLYHSIVKTTGANYGYGIEVANGGTFEAKDLEVSTTGDNSDAIAINAGATATINGARLITAGKNAEGIQANASSFTGSGVEITTLAPDADAYSNGVLLLNGSTGQLTNSSITTAGGYSAGLWAHDSSSFTGAGLTIKTSGGPFGEGVLVYRGSSVILDNSSVTTAGAEAVGVGVFGVGSSFGLKGGSIATSGTNSHAVSVNDGATAILTDVNTSASGDGASAIHVNNTAGTDRGSVTVNGGSLSSAAGPLIWVDAGHSEITLNGPVGISPGISNGRNVLADVINDSDLDLTFNSVSDITGDVDVSGAGTILDVRFNQSDWTGNLLVAGGSANLDLIDSTWTGRSAGATSITVDNTSVWNVAASSNAGAVSNAGLISFVAGDTSSTLSAGSYIGQNGRLGINTVLGADDSATNRLIIVGGSATGTTGLVVRNAGGFGAQTTGDGIRVVETQGGATTDTNAFHLSSRAAAGAYEYRLFRGGKSGSEDWFLRSHLAAPVPEVPDVPLYRPEVPLYAPVPAIARDLGLKFLGTLHERVGEQMNIKQRLGHQNHVNGTWARILGETGRSQWTGSADI